MNTKFTTLWRKVASWKSGKTRQKYKFPYLNFQLSEIYKIYIYVYIYVLVDGKYDWMS